MAETRAGIIQGGRSPALRLKAKLFAYPTQRAQTPPATPALIFSKIDSISLSKTS